MKMGGGNIFPTDFVLDVFINNAQALENQIQQGEQEEAQIPAPAAAEVQLVYECCEKIRLQGLHPHPDIQRISGDLLRLEDTSDDLRLYAARVEKRALEILEKLNDVFLEPANIMLTPYEPTLRAQLVAEALAVVKEYHSKVRRRLKRITQMYKYHIRSIQELQLRKAKGELESDVFSQTKFNYLSDRCISLRITSGNNGINLIPLGHLIFGITCYLVTGIRKRKKQPLLLLSKTVRRRIFYKNVPFLGLFYFICTVIITAIIIVKNC